ncbi:hypothetical protein GCM10027565_18150 [Bordetella tumulicola]
MTTPNHPPLNRNHLPELLPSLLPKSPPPSPNLGLADSNALRGQNLNLTLNYDGLSTTRDSRIPAQTP